MILGGSSTTGARSSPASGRPAPVAFRASLTPASPRASRAPTSASANSTTWSPSSRPARVPPSVLKVSNRIRMETLRESHLASLPHSAGESGRRPGGGNPVFSPPPAPFRPPFTPPPPPPPLPPPLGCELYPPPPPPTS